MLRRTYTQRMFLALQLLIRAQHIWGQHPNAERCYVQIWRVISCINAEMWQAQP